MIRVAVIGAGHWGPNLIRNFHNKQTSQVLWVVDSDRSRLAQVAARFPDVRITDNATIALGDERVAAIVVATPTSTHYDLARAALGHGKHVLVEKPIATSVREAEELCELAEKTGRVLMVGHVFLHNAAVQRVKRYLDAGELGAVYYIAMVRTNLGPIRLDVNATWDLASHDISIANYWLGSEPCSVSALGGTWLNPGIEDAVFATLRYPHDVLVTLHVSWLNPRKAREITVVGETRMLTFDDLNLSEPLRLYDKRVTNGQNGPPFVDTFASFRANIREGDIAIPRVPLGEPLKAECDAFLDALATGKCLLTGGREGVAVVRALETIQRSLRSGGREEQVVA